jgi:hypothetical protein
MLVRTQSLEDSIDEIDVVRRALALRKQKRIGVLFAENGKYWIAESELDPYGTRVRISIDRLRELVELLEPGVIRRGPERECGVVRFDPKSHIA